MQTRLFTYRLIQIIASGMLLSACATRDLPVRATPTTTGLAVEIQALASIASTPTATKPAPSATATVTPTPLATATATLPPQDYGPDNFPSDVNPLTGLPVEDPALLERRPIAVKIQIFPRGQRPPIGVSLADIVYDYYQNNGLTRFNAIFYGNDSEQVGPIRSARYFDDHIIRMYKTIFVFGGADRLVIQRLFNSEYYNWLVLEGSGNCPALCRVDPNGFNYLVGNTAEIGKYATSKGVDNVRQNLNGMTFEHQPPSNGGPGQQIYNRYSISAYSRWDYDPTSGRYLRFQDTQEDTTGVDEAYTPLTDRQNGAQIAADNVVILFATHNPQPGGNTRIDIDLIGSGKALAFRNGQAYEVQWNRQALDSVLSLTDQNGQLFPFKPGNTWFQVMGLYTKIEEKAPGVWRFENRIP
ncbi:MAG: hypothetical protein A2W36_05170 [Chloroflexi bacterium RBG_16_58_14]|nr:MAG: hypothetical protein A2W36_05170 [Chloroflexi bacterium RBG_16_58_14]